jgi:hypothetical protein
MLRFSIILLFATFLFASCRSTQKMVERGNYDQAIDFSIRKLRGKRNKQLEHVQGLETAFKKAIERDMRFVAHLDAVNHPENWERIHTIHRRIASRQERIRPLLPLRAKTGYQAEFMFVRIEDLERESREKAAEHLYTRATELLAQAEQQGSKQAARDAHALLLDLEKRFFKQYRDKDQLLRTARQLGTVHVLFSIENHSRQVLPRSFNERVLALNASDLNSSWKRYYVEPVTGVRFDYRAVLNILDVDISPERIRERSYIDETELQDGWNYVLDERGNVRKDTAGNDLKTPRYVRLRANVLEAWQTKAARLTTSIDIFAADRNARLDSHEMSAEILFEHYASTFQGDARALSEQSRCRIGNRPQPFPATEAMLAQAADRLKPQLHEQLRQNRVLN